MKILQLLPTLAFGDAVSNDTIALKRVIKELGFKTGIYAENIDPRLPKGTVCPVKKLPKIDSNDIIIYHLSTGTSLNYEFAKYNCRKIIIYHNITPKKYFWGYSDKAYRLSEQGYLEARYLSDKVDSCLADSTFNKEELIRLNYKCPIDVLPILIPFDDYKRNGSKSIIHQFNDDFVNIIFTGRIAPNKKHEDIIESFYYYKNYINPRSRLFLIGSYNGMEKYYEQLNKYVYALQLRDVYFTGHIKFEDIIAYYKIADIFLCLSEHEGFCVPLVEAMEFQVPIIAYDSSAISWTLGGSGILLEEKDPIVIAEFINKVMADKTLREEIVHNQNLRLKDFEYEIIKGQFVDYLKKFIENERV